MSRVVGLDIGSGFTKCYDGKRKLIFPSIYCYRQPTVWEEEKGIIEGVGEKALEIAQYPNAVKLYPILEGKPQHQAFIKVSREAFKKLKFRFFNRVCLVSGLPYETGKQEREEVKHLLKKDLGLSEIAVYPQAIGTLFNLDLKSGTVINIGHSTTEILIVEKLNVLGGMSEPLASDYIIAGVSNTIQAKHGFKASTESIVDLMVGKTDRITSFGKATVHRRDVEEVIEGNVEHLADKICYDARHMLTQLPSNLECTNRIILSGGGSLIKGLRNVIEQKLDIKALMPRHPLFSNVCGFYKIGKELYG